MKSLEKSRSPELGAEAGTDGTGMQSAPLSWTLQYLFPPQAALFPASTARTGLPLSPSCSGRLFSLLLPPTLSPGPSCCAVQALTSSRVTLYIERA